MNCQQVQEELSIALLRRQPLDAEITAHCNMCPTCAADAQRLQPLVELLAAPERQAVLVGEQLRPEALDRLLAEASRRAHRRRGRWLVAVAAAVALLVPLGVVALHQISKAPTVEAVDRIVRSATNPATGVSAQVKVWPAEFGSGLNVSLTGVPAGTKCTLSVVKKDGTRQTAATWWASYQGAASVDGTVAASIKDIDRLEVLNDAGQVLVPVPLA